MNLKPLRSALLSLSWEMCCLDIRRHSVVAGIVRDLHSGAHVADERLSAAVAGATPAKSAGHYRGPQIYPGPKGKGSIAVVSFHGMVLYDLEFQPLVVSAMNFARVINELAATPSVGTIVIDMDSPGGVATGVPEAADAVFAARQKKPVVCLVNPLSASAGYWIASQATEIIVVPSGDVGSVGVYMLHMDLSAAYDKAGIKPTYIYSGANKIEGNSLQPLSKETLEYFQRECDKTYSEFIRAVARGRRTTVEDVRNNFGKGRCFIAREAKALGMVDHIEAPGAMMFRVSESRATDRLAASSEGQEWLEHCQRELQILEAGG